MFHSRKKTVALLGLVACATLMGGVNSQALVQNCPQPRFTGKAPDDYYNRKSPLTAQLLDAKAGEKLYFDGATDRFSCATCHGSKGDGHGEMAKQYDPPPRNFSCPQAVNGVPDGHLFWIVRFGSPGTGMPAHKNFSDDQIWQLVAYVRGLAK
ncbi:MAG: c-type cytochrome [Burkholderiales bacterium]|nr:c-type cytochrome [Burkholderiales bacterium]